MQLPRDRFPWWPRIASRQLADVQPMCSLLSRSPSSSNPSLNDAPSRRRQLKRFDATFTRSVLAVGSLRDRLGAAHCSCAGCANTAGTFGHSSDELLPGSILACVRGFREGRSGERSRRPGPRIVGPFLPGNIEALVGTYLRAAGVPTSTVSKPECLARQVLEGPPVIRHLQGRDFTRAQASSQSVVSSDHRTKQRQQLCGLVATDAGCC
jgi:hypothetical protein